MYEWGLEKEEWERLSGRILVHETNNEVGVVLYIIRTHVCLSLNSSIFVIEANSATFSNFYNFTSRLEVAPNIFYHFIFSTIFFVVYSWTSFFSPKCLFINVLYSFNHLMVCFYSFFYLEYAVQWNELVPFFLFLEAFLLHIDRCLCQRDRYSY